MSHKFIVHEK